MRDCHQFLFPCVYETKRSKISRRTTSGGDGSPPSLSQKTISHDSIFYGTNFLRPAAPVQSSRQYESSPISGPSAVSTSLIPSISEPIRLIQSTKVDAHTPLPPRSVLLNLIEIYFTHVNNQTYGFLHQQTFLRHVEERKISDGLLYSICAISARFSSKHAPPPLTRHSTQETPAYHAGESYAIEARKLALHESDKPTVQNVQMLILLALHDFGGEKGQNASWMFAGMAIRMASALKLNREMDGNAIAFENTIEEESRVSYGAHESRSSSREKVTWTEREIRRRTFWACFIMEV